MDGRGFSRAVPSAARAVDGGRVLAHLAELAKIGVDPAGGISRTAYSAADREAVALAEEWMCEAGLTVAADQYGNVFGSSDGNRPNVKVSLSGSHLDTVPNGGALDGAYGVVAAIEAAYAILSSGEHPRRPLEVVIWRCEEPVRFAHGKVGSYLFGGRLTTSELVALSYSPTTLADLLSGEPERSSRASDRAVATAIELHIEQGRRLEDAGCRLGIVTGVASPTRMRIVVSGRADHSGATPMQLRRDALCAAAEVVLLVEQAPAEEAAAGTVATTAAVTCEPNAINVIPGRVELLIDVRGTEKGSIDRVVMAIQVGSQLIAKKRGVAIDDQVMSRALPTVLDPDLVKLCEEAASLLGSATMRMPSGAGHDIQALEQSSKTCMLFVPSIGGVSHSPDEASLDEDLVGGARSVGRGLANDRGRLSRWKLTWYNL